MNEKITQREKVGKREGIKKIKMEKKCDAQNA